EFPAANHPIITALRLPPRCLITPDPGKQTDFFLQKLVNTLITGIDLIVLRAKSLDTHEYKNLAQKVNALCAIYDSQLLVYGDADLVEQVRADGLHLSSHDLLACKTRPISPDKWLSASCHTEYEIEHAEKIGVDFVFLSAVLETNSHSDAFLLGWNGFQRLVANAKIPVYALGGMSTEHLPLAFDAGAQGIAGISGLWIDSV
ncbi:MAG: thiamine phosphate synthase, partial [Nitrosopumilus sp.]|nr:thiamine phosphate synthase [Nitrosopumilus sp.]